MTNKAILSYLRQRDNTSAVLSLLDLEETGLPTLVGKVRGVCLPTNLRRAEGAYQSASESG
jgi:hypothetical protein